MLHQARTLAHHTRLFPAHMERWGGWVCSGKGQSCCPLGKAALRSSRREGTGDISQRLHSAPLYLTSLLCVRCGVFLLEQRLYYFLHIVMHLVVMTNDNRYHRSHFTHEKAETIDVKVTGQWA